MKKILIFASAFLLFPFLAFSQSHIPIAPNLTDRDKNPGKIFPVTVEYPHQNSTLVEGSTGAFIFGQVTPATGILKINGTEVPLYKNGAYLAYVPVKPGNFDFILEFNDGEQTHTYRRSIFVKGFDYHQYEGKYRFDPNYIFPTEDIVLSANDIIDFTVSASPGQKVKMSLGSQLRSIEMPESPKEKGVYKKSLAFADKEPIRKPISVSYVMYDKQGREKARVSSKGKIRIVPPEEASSVVTVKRDNIRPRPGPLPKTYMPDIRLFGKLEVTGRMNNMYRIALDSGEIGWVERSAVTPSRLETVPLNTVKEITVVPGETKTLLTIKNAQRVSFKLAQTPKTFDIILYYTDEIEALPDIKEDKLLQSIDYKALSYQTKKITARFLPGKTLWGYNYDYKGNDLVFELFHRPDFAFTAQEPLKGLKVMLDPGHSPNRTPKYDGAVGPTGVLEYEVNFRIAQAAAQKLAAMGAVPLLSKEENEQVNLAKRRYRALEQGVHMFISIHNNALPDNVNPFTRERGFGIYYYHDHSIPLAADMERAYIKNIGLPTGGLVQADLQVVRSLSNMPAILVENVYLMFPIHEELALQDKFIDMLGAAIAEGVLNYINPPAAAKAAVPAPKNK